MKKSGIIFLLAGLLYSCQTSKEAKITFILPENSEGVSVKYDGQLVFIDKEYQTYTAQKNETGSWEVTIPLSKPQYFMVRRNPLYISPGDHLTIEVNEDPELTKIEGIGAEVNNYLKKRYYLKGGSFLRSGNKEVMKPTLEEMLVVLDSLVEARQKDLAALKAGKKFKEQEAIRIKADFTNSLYYYPNYNRHYLFGDATTVPIDEYNAKIKGYFEEIKSRVQPLLDEMCTDDRFLDIDVVRTTLLYFHVHGKYNINSERFNTLFEIADQSNYIRGSMSKKEYDDFFAFGKTIQSEELKKIYMDRLERYTLYTEGKPAIDVTVIDLEGLQKKLSDYQGNVMYVDVWATWCAPCRQQAPFFKALSDKYPNIRFVALSVDDKKSTWDNYMKDMEHVAITELWAESDVRKDWGITGIPRFFLINKDFTIISSDAPRPSTGEQIEALLEKYSQ